MSTKLKTIKISGCTFNRELDFDSNINSEGHFKVKLKISIKNSIFWPLKWKEMKILRSNMFLYDPRRSFGVKTVAIARLQTSQSIKVRSVI